MLREKLRPEDSRKACLRRQKEEARENYRPVVMRCTGSGVEEVEEAVFQESTNGERWESGHRTQARLR